jgi:SET domain
MSIMTRHRDDEHEDEDEDDDDEDEDSEEEGFRLLMGGRLRWEDLAAAPLTAWDVDDRSVRDQGDDPRGDTGKCSSKNDDANATRRSSLEGAIDPIDSSMATACEREPKGGTCEVALPGHNLPNAIGVAGDEDDRAHDHRTDHALHNDGDDDHDQDSFAYSLAHGFELSGSRRLRNRTVRIADVAAKGRGLVAARHLPRGTVLYTERAAVACQVVVSASGTNAQSDRKSKGIGDGDSGNGENVSVDCDDDHQVDDADGLYNVRACQQCFRSLEPCLDGLPHPELWPVVGSGTVRSPYFSSAAAGRDWPSQCPDCGSWFCSMTCQQQLLEQYGSCCDLRNATRLLLINPNIGEDVDLSAEPAIALAVRMLRHCLQHNRQRCASRATRDENSDDSSQSALGGTMLRGLCGDPADVTPLELGFPNVESESPKTSEIPENDNCPDRGLEDEEKGEANSMQQSSFQSPSIPAMTLEPLHKQLVDLWSISPIEASVFNVRLFHRLAAMAARNGVGMSPVSPFATYYQTLIRHAGGRGTEAHAQVVEHVARAVSHGATSCLERGMDRRIQEIVSPRLVAIFPLTSRINHDCEPNAELVTSFVDCHVDVQLIRDVHAGEEITINYVGRFGGRNKSLECRRTELRRRYLFVCRCRLCLVHSGE